MLLPHTQKSLDQLTWNEVQKIHSSLGLKATATTRTRRDYQRRIVEAQPQPVAEPEITASATFTCAQCPLARHIDGDRYCCQVAQTASDVTRGHWEATVSCYEAIAEAEAEQAAATSVVEVEVPPPIATIASIPHATKPKADDNFMTAFTKESEDDRKFNDLAYLFQCQFNAQVAVEGTEIGSEDERIALMHLEKINKDIEYYNRLVPEPKPSPAVSQLEAQMKELKTDVLSLFKITPFDPGILPVDAADESEQPINQVEPEGTIHWCSSVSGTIVGKKGATRNFYIRNDEIFLVISNDFTASESKKPNIRHQQIRAAVTQGKLFDPRAFKSSPTFERNTEEYRGIGRIRQECDGRWWAWAVGGVTGHAFESKRSAVNYLEAINFTSKKLASAK